MSHDECYSAPLNINKKSTVDNPSCFSLNRAFLSHQSFLTKSYMDNEDVIKGFRNAFLEGYLEKNKVGRKSKNISKQKSKSKAVDTSSNESLRKQHDQSKAIDIPQTGRHACNLFEEPIIQLNSTSNANTNFHYTGDISSIFNEKNQNDLSALLDQDMFSFNENVTSTYSTYPSENGSYNFSVNDDHIVSNVNIPSYVDQRDSTDSFFENSDLMSNMKIYFENSHYVQNDNTITNNCPDYCGYSNDMQGKNLNIIPSFDLFMNPQENVSYSIDDSQKIFSLDFEGNC